MSDYSGVDRREKEMDYEGPPKRKEEKCLLCDVLWKNHDDERVEARKHICREIGRVAAEITELKKDNKSMTPWKVFALSMVLVIGSIGGSIAWLAGYIDKGQTEIKTSVTAIHARISTNDREDETAMRGVTDSLRDLNYSVQSIDSRLRNVEKFVESRSGK